MGEVEVELRNIVDDMHDDLDVCKECTGTWKVACYGAWNPNSQFWDDFLEDGWNDGAYSPKACCLRLMCGLLFCFFAPVWCCKAILFFLCWPCICCGRAVKDGNCNKKYFRFRHSKHPVFAKNGSQPLAYIESAQPNPPAEISNQFSPKSVPPESPIPEIRIETEQENGTYVTSPVEDDSNNHQLSAINSQTAHWVNKRTQVDDSDDMPPPYPMTESPRARSYGTHTHTSNNKSTSSSSLSSAPPAHTHSAAAKTMSSKAKGMDNNLYRAMVMEGFQNITGKVTSV